MKFRERAVLFLATGFFSGHVPFAPGTFGTLIGLPICFLLSRFQVGLFAICVVLFIFFAIKVASAAEKIIKQKDPAQIVIDEIAGLLVVYVGLPFNLQTAVFGFIIFRVFDILKPFPIRLLEKKIKGGSGIVFDDVVAGIYANLILRLAIFMIGVPSSP
ncbi:MAG: phosphatidylglycerophosphatase A [Deltaproteobacteria bacterium]|jgi:phosphatidylglycerophosphatase A|nr:phosphatidylglycerophosphatase A [Deltaproteobacteria bacterium]